MKALKKEIFELLQKDDFEENISRLHEFPAKKAVNALFSFLCSMDETIKKRAIIAMGEIVSMLAEENMESARIIMRRLMWSLNDESGGVGWGAPGAIAEIMAKNEKMAQEYHKIFLSYISKGKNFIEFDKLQEEFIAAFNRLKEARPDLVENRSL